MDILTLNITHNRKHTWTRRTIATRSDGTIPICIASDPFQCHDVQWWHKCFPFSLSPLHFHLFEHLQPLFDGFYTHKIQTLPPAKLLPFDSSNSCCSLLSDSISLYKVAAVLHSTAVTFQENTVSPWGRCNFLSWFILMDHVSDRHGHVTCH